ncbi:tricarballylate dehydrogenase [Betaproteobacteria bacterium]|nr:tricarballylate dehydrogenase [Betaproteobacteria bacterium]
MQATNRTSVATYDVIVVGGGNAGLAAAIEARNNKARVLLIEKSPKARRGGNSRYSYGDFRVITTGTRDIVELIEREDMLKGEVEIEPLTKEFFYGEAMRLSEGLADKRLTEIFVERSLEAVRWLKEQGVRWTLNPALAFEKDGRKFFPAGNANIQAVGSGPGLVEMLYTTAESKGIFILYDTAVRRLTVDGHGRISGVVAKAADELIEFRAPNVILCCGGFQASPEKRRAYLGENMDLVLLRGSPYNTGDWIRMADEIGAQFTGHWSQCHAPLVSQNFITVDGVAVTDQRYSFPYGIMVNRRGERFVDEGENFYCWTYNRLGKEILRQPGSVAYQIFDDKVFPLVTYKDAVKVESDTLEGLAEKAGIDPEGFVASIHAFNDAVVEDGHSFVPYELDGRRTRGLNPNKTNWACTIDKPPYRAYAVICGLTMTYGGLKTDEHARVIDTSNRPIAGLYAVGEVTGGYFYHTYLGGSGMIRGTVMGRIAGAGAASDFD